MTKAIRIHSSGGPDVIQFEDVGLGKPARGEALVRQTAVGVNFIDVYHRSGLYKLPSFPSGLGTEGAGVVEAVGPGVKDIKVGQRVAYAGGPLGSYAEARIIAADRLVPLPKDIDDQTAAAMMLKGMTAEYLVRRVHKVKAGETILAHAAAGGVGTILCQWARALGAKVIGTVGSDEKAAIAKKNGCAWPIVYTRESFVERVREITKGKGVPVVYDSVGRSTFLQSLDCLQPMGLMVAFGNSSGAAEPIDPLILSHKGSLFLTRPSLFIYNAKREDLLKSARALFSVVRSGKVKIKITATYPLKDAARAHADLQGRKTTGSVVLIP